MMHHQILSGPASTRRLKANLSLAIDEAILTRKISGLQEQLVRLRNQPAQLPRTRFLRHELTRLEKVLIEIRESASIDE